MAGPSAPEVTLRTVLADGARFLAANPGMTSSELLAAGRELLARKKAEGLAGIFPVPPRLMTATLDDGLGQGLSLIHCFAELAGLTILPLGLMRTPAAVVDECRRQRPDILGLTVLHDDTEEDLCELIIPRIPDTVRVIVGGPVFKAMTAETLARKPYRVLNSIPLFLAFLLDMNCD
jgi:methylmalonyl-CoA mutase cobalamin-binding subunit